MVNERGRRSDKEQRDIGRAWGAAQAVVGPVLIVPFEITEQVEKRIGTAKDGTFLTKTVPVTRRHYLYLLPKVLTVAGDVHPTERYRGIYRAVLYRTKLQLSGRFVLPDVKQFGIDPDRIRWSEAALSMGITDSRGIVGTPSVTLAGKGLVFAAGPGKASFLKRGIHARFKLDPDRTASGRVLAFAIALRLNGQKRISVAPAGARTIVSIKSPWRHPSFDGAFLPLRRTIGNSGFSSNWEVSSVNRNVPQAWTDWRLSKGNVATREVALNLYRSMFGVSLVTPVDFYLKSERAVKHGILYVVLIFVAIFVFEIVGGGGRLHPVHYGLVGSGLSLFYLLLLSLSEVIGFAGGYVIAALLSVLTIAPYLGKVMGGWRPAAFAGGLLAAVYTYLYVVLQLEDLALLAGALGLFAALAITMYATRNIDWYALETFKRAKPAPATDQEPTR